MALEVSREDVIAFRLSAQHLTERSGPEGLLDATRACGVQNSPPGSALLALHARVRDVSQERMDQAVAGDKSLLQSWCMRGSPFYFPTTDVAVFTTGVLPPSEETMRHFVLGVGPAVDELGLSLTETVELTGAEIGLVLAGRRLAIDELGKRLAERIAPKLSKAQRDIWERDGPYAAGQPLGEAIVHFCIRILTLQGVVCFGPREGKKAPFVLVDEWLGHPLPATEPEAARAELLRRYLRCYGPSTRADFAAWLGVRSGDADPWWRVVETEVTAVDLGRTAWVLTEDIEALRSAQAPTGVRLLPPRDPYTQTRDRETLVEKKYHREVWKPVGDPGTVLLDGEITGVWRPRKRGRRLTLEVTPFAALSAQDKESLRAEAEQVATLRGASSVEVEFGTH
jgi:DNA glycosylase AlkZ-like